MKVMCIRDDWKIPEPLEGIEAPVFGSDYTVTGSELGCGITWYFLSGLKSNISWDSSGFIEIPSIDETEMVRNLQTETA